jgi:hypothetical protein
MNLTRVSAVIPWCLMELGGEAWGEPAQPPPPVSEPQRAPPRAQDVDERMLIAAGVAASDVTARVEARAPEPEPTAGCDDRQSRPAARRAERVRIEQPLPGRVALLLALARRPAPTVLYQDASSQVDLVRCPAGARAR